MTSTKKAHLQRSSFGAGQGVVISNDTTLPEELVEVLPSEWNLEDDELPVVPHLKKYFTESAWLIVEDGLKHLKQKANNSGKQKFIKVSCQCFRFKAFNNF